MEIDPIKVLPSLRVEQAGSERERRRRNQPGSDFADTLKDEQEEKKEEREAPPAAAPGSALPGSIDIVSISLAAHPPEGPQPRPQTAQEKYAQAARAASQPGSEHAAGPGTDRYDKPAGHPAAQAPASSPVKAAAETRGAASDEASAADHDSTHQTQPAKKAPLENAKAALPKAGPPEAAPDKAQEHKPIDRLV